MGRSHYLNLVKRTGASGSVELKLQREFDSVTEELIIVCGQLSRASTANADHLRLKASALLYLLPEDGGLATILATSLCNDLVETVLP